MKHKKNTKKQIGTSVINKNQFHIINFHTISIILSLLLEINTLNLTKITYLSILKSRITLLFTTFLPNLILSFTKTLQKIKHKIQSFILYLKGRYFT